MVLKVKTAAARPVVIECVDAGGGQVMEIGRDGEAFKLES
jgi:hypothetical protein